MMLLLRLASVSFGLGICSALQQPLVSIHDDESPLLVAVMGPTGSGKSSFINSVLGTERFVVGKGMASQTSQVEDELIRINGRLVRLVDTPGFDDTNLTDTHVLDMIVTWMGIQYKQKTKFAGILYLRDITEFRMKGSDMKNLRMFRALCGTTGLENVIVVSTKWNMMVDTVEMAENRERELKTNYLKPMLVSGAEYTRDDGTAQSSRTIIRKVLQKDRGFYLDVQREIIDEGKRLNQIEAGKVLQEQLLEAKQEYEEKLIILGEELKDAHSKEMREALEEQRQDATEAIKRAEAAQSHLNEQYGKKFEEQEKLFRQMMENLRQDYEDKMQKASEEEKERLGKQHKELEKALKAADKGDSSVMWTVAEKVIRTSAITYSINAVGALFGLPPFLLQGIVHGAMHTNINLTAVTAILPGVLSEWARPLANLSDLNLSTSSFSRLGLQLSNVSDWGIPLANLSKLASQYGSLALHRISELQARLSSGDWTASLANLSETATGYYSTVNLSEFALAAWANDAIGKANWTSLACGYANMSELRRLLSTVNVSDWSLLMTNSSDLTAHFSVYTDKVRSQLQQVNATAIATKLPGLFTRLFDSLVITLRAGYAAIFNLLLNVLYYVLEFILRLPNPLPQLGQAALTTGVNFVLPILLAQLAPKMGIGTGTGTGAPAIAPPAAEDLVQTVNLNYFTDLNPLAHSDFYLKGDGASVWDTLPQAAGEFSFSDWLIKGIEEVAMPIVELVDAILD